MLETTAKLGKVSAKMIDAEVKELRQAVKIRCLLRSSVDADSSDEVRVAGAVLPIHLKFKN